MASTKTSPSTPCHTRKSLQITCGTSFDVVHVPAGAPAGTRNASHIGACEQPATNTAKIAARVLLPRLALHLLRSGGRCMEPAVLLHVTAGFSADSQGRFCILLSSTKATRAPRYHMLVEKIHEESLPLLGFAVAPRLPGAAQRTLCSLKPCKLKNFS